MFGACALLLSLTSQAQSAKEIIKSPNWTKASVVTDGGAVYTSTDFDSPVKEYLAHGTVVWLMKKSVHGRGGLGIFHKVRYKTKSGYMADTDIRILPGKGGLAGAGSKAPQKTSSPPAVDAPTSMAWEREEQEEARKGPQGLFFTRYVGGALGLIQHTEKFSGKKLSSSVPMVGLRMSGPGVLFDGPPLDVNILFTPQTPGYYSRVTDQSVNGFMFLGDVMAILPFLHKKNSLFYYGLGLMWTYSSYKVSIAERQLDSQDLRIGAEFGLGYVHRLGRTMAVRLDGRYFYEKTQYFGLITSLQTEF